MANKTDVDLRLLLLPGWLDSNAPHWQRRWEQLHGCLRVEQSDWIWPKRGDWMARLDEVVLESDRPALLIGHGLGCHLIAAWAAHSQHTSRVRGALLVAPRDLDRDDTPPNLFSWRPMIRTRLPFAGVAVISRNDPYCAPERAEQIARDWGAAAVDSGPCGPINSDSSLGDWPQGWALLQALLN